MKWNVGVSSCNQIHRKILHSLRGRQTEQICPKIRAKMAKFSRSRQRRSRISSKYLQPGKLGLRSAHKWPKSMKIAFKRDLKRRSNVQNSLKTLKTAVKYVKTTLRAPKTRADKFCSTWPFPPRWLYSLDTSIEQCTDLRLQAFTHAFGLAWKW